MRTAVQLWWQVVHSPSVATFDRQRPNASWRSVWLSLVPLAVVEALSVAYTVYRPDAAAGYSSLPVGPKLHLPPTPLLPLAALVGSPLQFLMFSGLLCLVAHLLGGWGDFKTQSYLMVLFWVPLMIASDLAEFVPVVGSFMGVLIRSYALVLCVPALAAANQLSTRRAIVALLLPVVFGLLLGIMVLSLLAPHLQGLLDIR